MRGCILRLLSFNPEVAWLACNPTMDGREIAQVGPP
jgi:hypothetical protein